MMLSVTLFHKNVPVETGGTIRTLTPFGVVSVSFLFLISIALLYPSVSNPVFGILIGLPIVLGGMYYLINRYDTFSFLMVIFFCNHFRFYESIWCLLFLGASIFFKPAEFFKRRKKGQIFIFLFSGLYICNLVGLLTNDHASPNDIFLGIGVFTSYLLIFNYLIGYQLVRHDAIRFFQVLVFLIGFQLLVSVSQKLGKTSLDLPFLPLSLIYDESIGSLSLSRTIGTFGDFELFAEYTAFLLVFFLCLCFYKNVNRVLPFRVLLALVIVLFITMLLTGTRSSLLLVGACIPLLLILHLRVLFKLQFWFGVILCCVGIITLIQSNDVLGLNLVFSRLGDMNLENNGRQSSDEIINRDVTFQYAYKRLKEKAWIVGEGYTNGMTYKKSLFGKDVADVEVGNYHSLYLSTPIFFGWAGAIFFWGLILASLGFYLKQLFKFRKSSFKFHLLLGLFLTWTVLFVNEYKIEFIRFPNHLFLIWFWMALSLNLSNNVSNENNYIR